MSNDHPKRDSMSSEEATVFNMWEIADIVEVLAAQKLGSVLDLTLRGCQRLLEKCAVKN
jgi:hypothetical protein